MTALLMAHVGWAEIEAEPVLVSLKDGRASLLLDDGLRVEFDANELREALNAEAEAREAA